MSQPTLRLVSKIVPIAAKALVFMVIKEDIFIHLGAKKK